MNLTTIQDTKAATAMMPFQSVPAHAWLPEHLAKQHHYALHWLPRGSTTNIVDSTDMPGMLGKTQALIAAVFKTQHNAELSVFLPQLFAITDDEDNINAAIGLRYLNDAPVFLEQYLDKPVEQLIAQYSGAQVMRSDIVEVGNLAALGGGASRSLISFLVLYLTMQKKQWTVCTGTKIVRCILDKLNIPYEVFTEANPACLGNEQHKWGTYYNHNPLVLLINVASAFEQIVEQFCLEVKHP